MVLFVELILMMTVGALTASTALWWISRTDEVPVAVPTEDEGPLVMLFDDGILHHGTSPALDELEMEIGLNDWGDLRDRLVDRFPSFTDLATVPEQGNTTLFARDDAWPDKLEVRWNGPFCWVSLSQARATERLELGRTATAELVALRRASDALPHPVWQMDEDGSVIWRNQAYALLEGMLPHSIRGPDAPLFDAKVGAGPERMSLKNDANEEPTWYEVASVEVDAITVFHATCINPLVEAEDAQRNFVQTLAKTFAHLSIGLAIFDRKMQLALFNPALVDLSALSAEFLSGRPTMLSFFDQLRENRRMPEPKNYLTWRQKIADLIAAAADGRYEETWTLESGQTYRIRGRPHPDGATAFLIEDITAEVTLTRNFRAELELSQSLLDTVDDAIAVFSSSGVQMFCNAKYRETWKVDPDSCFADITIRDAIDVWAQQSNADAPWKELETNIVGFERSTVQTFDYSHRSAGRFACHIVPISAGATAVRFVHHQSRQTQTQEAATVSN